VTDLAGDWVTCRVHYWIEDPDRQDALSVKSAYNRAVKRRLEDAGIALNPATKRDLEGEVTVEGQA
jgi:small conductance mechanosensitive channel